MLKKIQLPTDTNFAIQFRRKNIDETWGPVINFKTIKNSTPPATPSKPTVVAWLGQLVVTWDGKSADGTAYLPDFYQCEIHVSEADNFTPTSVTKVQYFSSPGSNQQMTISDLTYNTKYFVKLVVTNTSGAQSLPSEQAYETVKRISGIELEDGSINLDKTNFTLRSLRQSIQYNQPNTPNLTNNPKNPPHYSDTWFDTDDKYKFYRYDHATPFRAQGANESNEAYYDANDAANDLGWREIPIGTAYQAAGSKVFYESTDPAANASNGDVWYQPTATGVLAKVRQNNAWVPLPWGQVADGSITASKIVANSITSNQIAANAITSDSIAANAIIASKIQSGAITADAIGANTIITRNANIANGVIDDAKIGNVSAGKLTAGTINANILLSGNIRTAQSGARIELGPGGMWLYNDQNQYTAFFSTIEGYASITGDITARKFRSQGALTGGNSFIEIGNTGVNDPVDEFRMFVGDSVASIRNPSSAPGVIRFSLTRPSIDTIDFYSNAMTTPGSYWIRSKSFNTAVGIDGQRISFQTGQIGSYMYFYGSDYNGNQVIRSGNDNGGAIKFLNGSANVQIRNAVDTFYGTLQTGDLSVSGTLTASSFNPASVYSSTIYSYGSLGAGGRITSGQGVLASGYLGYTPIFFNGAPANYSIDSAGTIASRDQIVSNGNVTSVYGYFYSNGNFVGSNPKKKSSIAQLNVDALSLLENVGMHAWYWNKPDGSPGQESNVGFLTSELPNILTPEAKIEDGDPGDYYNSVTMDALIVQGVNQLNSKLNELIDRVTALESA